MAAARNIFALSVVRFHLVASQLYQDVEISKGKLMKGQLIGSQFMQRLKNLATIIQVLLLPPLPLLMAVEIRPLLLLRVLLLTVLMLTVLLLTLLLLQVLLEAGVVLLLIMSLLLSLMHSGEVAAVDATAALSCGGGGGAAVID